MKKDIDIQMRRYVRPAVRQLSVDGPALLGNSMNPSNGMNGSVYDNGNPVDGGGFGYGGEQGGVAGSKRFGRLAGE